MNPSPHLAALANAALFFVPLAAQATSPGKPADSAPVQFTPFLVATEGDDGCRAANTLSSTRMPGRRS